MNNLLDDLKSAINKFSKNLYDATSICLANPKTLLDMDMSEIPSTIWFISQPNIEEKKVLLIKDDDLKRTMYKFCEENQDRIFKGQKSFLN